MTKITCSLKFGLLFLSLILQPSALVLLHAGAPLKINFQGRLEESGLPAEGAKNFIFKIYDAMSGGTLVWTSQAESAAVAKGVFSVVLETGTPVNLSTASFAGARYVEITVDGVPLSPRQEMVSAPYALVAQALSSDARISLSSLDKDPSAASSINTSTNAVDWSQLKNVPAGFADGLDEISALSFSTAAIASGKFGDERISISTAALVSGKLGDERISISTGAFYGGFNGPNQLARLDGSGRLAAGISLAGALSLPIKTLTLTDFPYTVTANDSTILINMSAGPATGVVNLPDAAGIAGRIYTFKRVDGSDNAISITAFGPQSIEGSSPYVFIGGAGDQWKFITCQSDGANWIILSRY
ncbi:MAG: hypothetical protein Q7R35_11645 [Elusimicrobiota bacterium]|nr:hypothetical protein [Elusimicrobiota bacterium]